MDRVIGRIRYKKKILNAAQADGNTRRVLHQLLHVIIESKFAGLFTRLVVSEGREKPKLVVH